MASRIEDGNRKHPLYRIWCAMKERCNNPHNKGYANYGGRGIRVCNSWSASFRQFVKDMGERPAGFEIDRIDNDKGYAPENCRWVSRKENALNRRKNTPAQIERNKKAQAANRLIGELRRASRTEFKCGHPYTPDNTYSHGHNRWCKICTRAKSLARHYAKKAQKDHR